MRSSPRLKIRFQNCEELLLHGLDRRAFAFAFLAWERDQYVGNHLFHELDNSLDNTANDIVYELCTLGVFKFGEYGSRLLSTSPNSPWAISLLIEDDWEKQKDKIDQYAELAKQHARLSMALSERYRETKEYEKAINCIETAIKQDPSFNNYFRLARIYKLQNNADKFRETYDDYLTTQPDFGLDHARANQEVARFYIRKRQWDAALPYATACASSGASWALDVLATVYEGLHQYDKADALYRAIGDRYGESSYRTWYYFCLRTGHGSEREARQSST